MTEKDGEGDGERERKKRKRAHGLDSCSKESTCTDQENKI